MINLRKKLGALLTRLSTSGADVNARDSNGATPLHRAMRSHSYPRLIGVSYHDLVTQHPAGAGADVNAQDENGFTSLHLEPGYLFRRPFGQNDIPYNIFLQSIDIGANVNVRTCDGNTPLHVATAAPGALGVEQVLVANGASVYARNDDGNTPLHCAVDELRGRFSSHVYSTIASAAARNNLGEVPQFDAIRSRRGESLLHWTRDVETIRTLIDAAGANVKVSDEVRMTPLHWKCRDGSFEEARALLDGAGAAEAASARDNSRRTPLQAALVASAPLSRRPLFVECFKPMLSYAGPAISTIELFSLATRNIVMPDGFLSSRMLNIEATYLLMRHDPSVM